MSALNGLPQGFRPVEIPERFRDHQLLRNGPFFTLPIELLESVVTEVGEDQFQPDRLEMDRALSGVMGDHSSMIGFWRGRPIGFTLLRGNDDIQDDSLVRRLSAYGKGPDQAREILEAASTRLGWTSNVRKGYCGWLMTSQTFIGEHVALIEDWDSEIAEVGLPW